MSDWKSIKDQANVFCFYAREFEGADFAQIEPAQRDKGIDVRKAGNAAAVRARTECKKLQRLLEDYHAFINRVIEEGGL